MEKRVLVNFYVNKLQQKKTHTGYYHTIWVVSITLTIISAEVLLTFSWLSMKFVRVVLWNQSCKGEATGPSLRGPVQRPG